jgi:hypothetical protein
MSQQYRFPASANESTGIAFIKSSNKKYRQRRYRLFCDLAGIRTQDPILKRDVLYLLSYQINIPVYLSF